MKASTNLGLLVVTCGILSAGCGEAVDPRIADLRGKLLVDTVPAGEVTVSIIRKQLASGDLSPGSNVVIRGRINAGESPPWERGKAAFVLTDATGHDGDEEHDPHTCPFCSRNIKDVIAWVRFLDADGNLIPIDSRELFQVSEYDLVVIRGSGSLDDNETLVINADKIFVKR